MYRITTLSKLFKRSSFSFALLFCLLSLEISSFAQTNFIPLERGDVAERQEYLMFTPGLHLSGLYMLNSSVIRSGLEDTKMADSSASNVLSFNQEIRLHMRSIVHRTVALNLELSALSSFHNADLRENTNSSSTPESQTIALSARQAYLEYTPYPRGISKLGKHFIEIGDRRGKVFSGILSGATQTCKAGTWCYQAGAMKLGPDTADWMYLFSLDYPFIHEVDAEQNPLNVFRVEIFRIKYSERNVPLGANNAPASRLSQSSISSLQSSSYMSNGSCDPALAKYTVDQNCVPIYFDANHQEFFGVRFLWETSQWKAYADVVSNQGVRRYHLIENSDGTQSIPALGENTGTSNRHHKQIQGVSSEIELSYRSGMHQTAFLGMSASGDKQEADPNGIGANFMRALNGYYEIRPGSYRGTNFWFNGAGNAGTSGTGLGHSVNNTTLAGIRYQHTGESRIYNFAIYELQRQEAVLDAQGNRASYIGIEVNNSISFALNPQLRLNGELNLFRTGPAFTFDDATAPAGDNTMITHVAAHILYSF